MADFTPTDEQAEAVRLAMTGGHLAIQAGAGTGKSATLKLIAKAKGRESKGSYWAFNSAIVKEAKATFPGNTDCVTSHAAAFRTHGRPMSHRLNGPRLKSSEIARYLSIDPLNYAGKDGTKRAAPGFLAGFVMKGVDRFCQTADPDPKWFHIPTPDAMRGDESLRASWDQVRKYLEPRLVEAWADMRDRNGRLPFSHNAYRKAWALDSPRIGSDFILLDECFPAGTMVETDRGPMPIEVIAACGEDIRVLSSDGRKMLQWSSVTASYRTPRVGPLVRVHHAGTSFVCTANHPIRVGNQWVPAGLLETGDVLRLVRRGDDHGIIEGSGPVLWPVVRREMGEVSAGIERPGDVRCSAVLHASQRLVADGTPGPMVLQQTMSVSVGLEQRESQSSWGQDAWQQVSAVVGTSPYGQSDVRPGVSSASVGNPERDRPSAKGAGWQRPSIDGPSADVAGADADDRRRWAMVPRACRPYWRASTQGGPSSPLQDRRGESRANAGRGGGWWLSQFTEGARPRREERWVSAGSRVDRVEVLQPDDSGRFGDGGRVDHVYTLSTEAGNYFADGVLVKNCQDTADVLLGVITEQMDHTQIIFVGDENQAIYGWAGAVSAMSKIEVESHCRLATSFRFGNEIAAVANEVLRMLPTDMQLVGAAGSGRVGQVEFPDVILTRTNSVAVAEMFKEIDRGGKPHIVGGAGDVLSFCRGAKKLMEQGWSDHPELVIFDSWAEVESYIAEDIMGEDLKLLVKLVNEFGADAIIGALEHMPPQDRASLVLSTGHKSKGLQFGSVKLTGDFPDDDPKKLPDDEALMLLYVAVTRAQRELDVSQVGLLRPKARA